MFQSQITGNVFPSPFIGLIDSIHCHNFLTIMYQVSVHMMTATIARQIYTVHFPIAQRIVLVYEFIQMHIGTQHHLSFGIHIVSRASQPSVHIGQIRKHTLELLEVDARKFHGHFLVGYGIFAVGVEMETGTLLIV